jgi:hypothetical protein
VREWWGGVIGSLGGIRFETGSFDAVRDRWVLTPLVITGTADDVDVEQAIWQVAEVVGGKVTWWGSYGTEREARDALEARFGE